MAWQLWRRVRSLLQECGFCQFPRATWSSVSARWVSWLAQDCCQPSWTSWRSLLTTATITLFPSPSSPGNSTLFSDVAFSSPGEPPRANSTPACTKIGSMGEGNCHHVPSCTEITDYPVWRHCTKRQKPKKQTRNWLSSVLLPEKFLCTVGAGLPCFFWNSCCSSSGSPPSSREPPATTTLKISRYW